MISDLLLTALLDIDAALDKKIELIMAADMAFFSSSST